MRVFRETRVTVAFPEVCTLTFVNCIYKYILYMFYPISLLQWYLLVSYSLTCNNASHNRGNMVHRNGRKPVLWFNSVSITYDVLHKLMFYLEEQMTLIFLSFCMWSRYKQYINWLNSVLWLVKARQWNHCALFKRCVNLPFATLTFPIKLVITITNCH